MKYYVAFVLLCLCSAITYGQNPYCIQLEKSNGLPCNEIYNLHQDKKGFIWIASDLGLYRYDGFAYKGYFSSNMSSKSGSYIREDEKGRIWYSTFDAKLFYVENDSLKAFESENGLSQNAEYAIIGNRIITLGRDNTLIILDIYQRKILHKISIIPSFTSLFQNGKEFSIGCGSTMTFYNESGRSLRTFHAEPGNNIYKIEPYKGKYYSLEVGNNKMYIYEIIDSSKKLIYQEFQNATVNGLYRIKNQLYILKKDGITQLNLLSNKVNNNLLKGKSASCIINDTKGYLWIGSSFDGISIFPSSATIVSHGLPIANSKIRPLADEFLLYNAKGLVYSFDLSTNKFHHIFTDKKKSSIYDVVPFNKGALHEITDDENRAILPYKNWNLFILKSGLKEIKVVNSKYVAAAFTGNAGLTYINKNVASPWDAIASQYRDTLDKSQQIISTFVRNIRAKSVTFDSINQILYYATNVGIITVTPHQVDELLFKQQKIYGSKAMFYKGTLFIYLHSGEILTKSNRSEVTFNEKLNVYKPYKFVKQQDSLLFLGTEKELFYINLDREKWEFKQIPFSKMVSELNDIIGYENHFYLSLNEQLIKIDKSNIVDTEELPFYINYIESNARKYYSTLNLKLTSAERDIKINFSALDYFHNNPNIFYKINSGIWRKSDANTRTISLASLAPDDYTISFSVNDKLYNNIIQFSIEERWYLRWWFILLVAAVLLTAIFEYYKRRLRSSQKESKLLLEKANLEKDLRQSMLSGIKSQMNPHFLFNALNTIQSYIITEDKTKASNYLSKFSKLTRKILEMSDKETISLHEEIDTLILYIDLEKMRFQELNYVIEIDKNIITNEILIPSMILQPYVENAIKHGLLHKQGDKQLFIRIGKLDKNLLIQIEDNGIGRNQSALINKSKGNLHHSFAAHANMKRVELLNIEKNEIGIEYIDKVDASGHAIGTTINIKIPIK